MARVECMKGLRKMKREKITEILEKDLEPEVLEKLPGWFRKLRDEYRRRVR